MNRYSCYLFGDNDEVTDVKEITADFEVKAVLLARTVAVQAGYSRFELRQHHRVIRRERWCSAA
jgi:hypothetical protein